MSFSLLCVVIENLLRALGCELRSEPRRLLAPKLAIVGATHFVRPTIAVRHRERHTVLSKYSLEPGTVYRTRVGESVEHLVAENLLEPAVGEHLTTLFPVRLGLLRIRQHGETFLRHQLVVQLVQPVLPARVPLQALTSEVVVVDDDDVRVRVPAGGVGVHDNQVVSRMHPLGELHSNIAHPVEVFLFRHVELVRAEREDIVVGLVLAPVRSRQLLSTLDELLGSRAATCHAQREGRSTVHASPLPLLRAVDDVDHARRRRGRRLHRHGAHIAVRSPSDARTSSTTPSTFSRRSSSTADPARFT